MQLELPQHQEICGLNLIIDIGNTRAKLVVFDGNKLIKQVFSDSNTLSALDELTAQYTFDKGILSTVAKIGQEAEERLNALPFPMTRLDAGTPLPVKLQWRKPGETTTTPLPPTMGADRIAAIVGAMCLMPNTPLLIVDAGTCVTYEVIDDEGFYIGGNIAPGLQMRLNAMHEHTALLPLVDGRGEVPMVGYDTETAMRCGAVQGLQYEIEGYIRQWREAYAGLQVFLTGGDKMTFDENTERIVHRDSYLVPRGLNSIL